MKYSAGEEAEPMHSMPMKRTLGIFRYVTQLTMLRSDRCANVVSSPF